MSRGRLVAGVAAVTAVGLVAARRRRAELAARSRVPRASRLAQLLDPYPDISSETMTVPLLPQGETVTVPARGEMFIRRAQGGSGVPVLLLHGWMASADVNWFRLFEALGERHPVVAPDHRGHGRGIRSPHRFSLEDCADDAAALLRHLGLAPAVIVGYSMGGPIATLLWQRHPELVAGLVLEATALEWQQGRQERVFWALMGPVAVLLRWPAGRLLLLRLIGGRGGLNRVPSELTAYRAWAEGEFRRGDPTDLADAGRELGRYDARPFAHGIDVPTAVVVTSRDSLVPAPRQRAMARVIGARVFEVPGDHSAAVLQSTAFAKVTLEAIAHVLGETPRELADG